MEDISEVQTAANYQVTAGELHQLIERFERLEVEKRHCPPTARSHDRGQGARLHITRHSVV